MDNTSYCGNTNQARFHKIDSFQFHSNVKPMVWNFLERQMKQNVQILGNKSQTSSYTKSKHSRENILLELHSCGII